MNRKIVGILVAIALAAVGTIALVSYVQSAKDEAVAGEAQVDAYVVKSGVNRGASLETVRDAVELAEVPAKVRPADAVTDIDELADDLVAGVDLAEGELLLRSRLVRADQLTRAQVPDGLQELTLSLSPERTVGGTLRAGDTVGIVLSFEPFDINGGGKTPNMSHFTFHKVLVTSVQFAQNEESPAANDDERGDGDEDDDEDEESVDRAPSNELLITMALSSPQVERVVFGAEFGHVWLTAEPEDATEDGTQIITLDNVYGTLAIPGGGQ